MIVLLKEHDRDGAAGCRLQAEARTPNSSPRHRRHCALLIAIVVMGAIAVFSLTEHLFIDNLPTAELFSGRWPLVLAAASAGAMLALAGTIMQSVTANPLASPEGLRVSAGGAPRRSRIWLLSLAALLTAAATLIVGPMSFVGLITPHIAAMTTPPKPQNRALCAAATGVALVTAADWLGRSLHFPYEIPAVVLAAFVGGAYFQWLIYRRHPSTASAARRICSRDRAARSRRSGTDCPMDRKSAGWCHQHRCWRPMPLLVSMKATHVVLPSNPMAIWFPYGRRNSWRPRSSPSWRYP